HCELWLPRAGVRLPLGLFPPLPKLRQLSCIDFRRDKKATRHICLVALTAIESSPEKFYSTRPGGIADGICNPGLDKPFEPQPAGVAEAAGNPFWSRVVAGVGTGVIDPQIKPFSDDFSLCQGDQRGMDAEFVPLDAGFCRQVRRLFEGSDIFGPTIGITGVVEGIHADENVEGTQHLGPAERKGEEDGISCRDIGYG